MAEVSRLLEKGEMQLAAIRDRQDYLKKNFFLHFFKFGNTKLK
jgi:hypothetical protein